MPGPHWGSRGMLVLTKGGKSEASHKAAVPFLLSESPSCRSFGRLSFPLFSSLTSEWQRSPRSLSSSIMNSVAIETEGLRQLEALLLQLAVQDTCAELALPNPWLSCSGRLLGLCWAAISEAPPGGQREPLIHLVSVCQDGFLSLIWGESVTSQASKV